MPPTQGHSARLESHFHDRPSPTDGTTQILANFAIPFHPSEVTPPGLAGPSFGWFMPDSTTGFGYRLRRIWVKLGGWISARNVPEEQPPDERLHRTYPFGPFDSARNPQSTSGCRIQQPIDCCVSHGFHVVPTDSLAVQFPVTRGKRFPVE